MSALAVQIPSDAHAAGDGGHPTDHNNICDVISLYAQALGQQTGISSSDNNTNLGAISNAVASNLFTQTQRKTVYTKGPQTFSSTSAANILSCPVNAGVYRVECVLWGSQGPVNAVQACRLTGPPASMAMTISNNWKLSITGESVFSTQNNFLNNDFNIAAHNSGADFYFDIRGIIVFTAAGTLNWQGRCATSGADTWICHTGAFMDVMPVT